MKACVVSLVFVLAAVGCNSSRLYPADYLDGEWGWQLNANPGGSSINLSLATAGTKVTGSGRICGVGPRACSPGPVTITGEHAGVAFDLTIRGGSGFVVTYLGQLVGQNELQGTWTEATDSGPVIFYRK
jgi:hypothetical protein